MPSHAGSWSSFGVEIPRDLRNPPVEAPLAFGTDLPIHGDGLIAFVEGLAFSSPVEPTPRDMFGYDGCQPSIGCFEIVVIILIHKDGNGPGRIEIPRCADLVNEVGRGRERIPVQQHEIRFDDDIKRRHDLDRERGPSK